MTSYGIIQLDGFYGNKIYFDKFNQLWRLIYCEIDESGRRCTCVKYNESHDDELKLLRIKNGLGETFDKLRYRSLDFC